MQPTPQTAQPARPLRYIPSWDSFFENGRDYTSLLLISIVLLAGVLWHVLQKNRSRRSQQIQSWRAVRRRCEAQNLSKSEETVLGNALKKSHLLLPEMAVVSRTHFDQHLRSSLSEAIGVTATETIAQKLFSPSFVAAPVGEEAKFDTRTLTSGRQLQVRFPDTPRTFQATVLRNDAEGFVTALRVPVQERPKPDPHEKVAGIVRERGGLYYFTSEVLETSSGSVFVCRIAHPETITEVRHRNSPRIRMNRPITITHIGSEEIGHAPVSLGRLQNVTGDRHPAQLQDISLGGCMISTDERNHFCAGDLVQFRFDVADSGTPLECIGSILTIRPDDKKHDTLHMEFIGMDETAQELLGLITSANESGK